MPSLERSHRYCIGQSVSLVQGFGYTRGSGVEFKVVALLPSNGAHFQYRIRNSGEAFERVAAENELHPSSVDAG
ncbi:MAG: hypothetical protein VX640_13130 [Pseudomonadota bacterium]|nr:hypothetical protein [Pseudomonadota bacterium]